MPCGVVKKRKKENWNKKIHQIGMLLKILCLVLITRMKVGKVFYCVNRDTICYYLLEDNLQI